LPIKNKQGNQVFHMTYKIAVASSDGKNVDRKFGETQEFLIYEVQEKAYHLLEKRQYVSKVTQEEREAKALAAAPKSCGGGGCQGGGNGCKGPTEIVDKVAFLEDCRCVVCTSLGFQAQKALEKKAIAPFYVDCSVTEALDKIVFYFHKIDHHEAFRGQ
jgi:hypothetical protein